MHLGNSIVGQIEETNGEQLAAQLEQGIQPIQQANEDQVNQQFADGTQQDSDQISAQFEGRESLNAEAAGAEQNLMASTQAGFVAPPVAALSPVALNIAQPASVAASDADVAALNVTQSIPSYAALQSGAGLFDSYGQQLNSDLAFQDRGINSTFSQLANLEAGDNADLQATVNSAPFGRSAFGLASSAASPSGNTTVAGLALDSVKALSNIGIDFIESSLNFASGELPGSPNYIPFLQGARASYETPLFGEALELIGGIAAGRLLGSSDPTIETASDGISNVANTLNNIENRFATNPREIGFIVDSQTGDILASRRAPIDSPLAFSLDADDYSLLNGNIFTHNHPGGGSFSVADVSTALGSGASEFRAVTADTTYSLSFDRSVSGVPSSPGGAVLFLDSERGAIGASYRAGVADGTLSVPDGIQGGVFRSQYFMQQLSNRNPFIRYTVTPR